MKTNLLLALCAIFLIGCNNKRLEPNFYKNSYTGEIFNIKEFEEYRKGIGPDSIKEKASITYRFYKIIKSGDSIIQPFRYDIRVGKEYLVRSRSYDKIGMIVPPTKFKLLAGKEIVIGGKSNKPTLINLWFTSCGGCIHEMPILNKLKDKYEGKVNFIAMTFNEAEEVSKFLNKKEFNFRHITEARDFIEEIKSHPYPENIFIDTNGVIRYIEPGIPEYELSYFESIIDELLQPITEEAVTQIDNL